MKNLICILILPLLLSCNDNRVDFIDPLSDLEKTTLKSCISNINQDSVSLFYEKMLEMSTQTINLSTEPAVRNKPLFIEMHRFFQNNLDNFPILFDFMLYDKRCTGEIQSNARLLLWTIAENNFKAVTEEMRKQLSKQDKVVDGVAITPPEVKFEYDIKLIKALLSYFE